MVRLPSGRPFNLCTKLLTKARVVQENGGPLTPSPLPIGRAASGEGGRLGRGDLRGPQQCFGAENRVIFAAFIGFRRRFYEEGKILPVLSRFS